MSLKTNEYFRNQHIKIEIRLPMRKHLDMNDEYDLQQAKEIVIREWLQTRNEVEKFLGITEEPKKVQQLSFNRDDFP